MVVPPRHAGATHPPVLSQRTGLKWLFHEAIGKGGQVGRSQLGRTSVLKVPACLSQCALA